MTFGVRWGNGRFANRPYGRGEGTGNGEGDRMGPRMREDTGRGGSTRRRDSLRDSE